MPHIPNNNDMNNTLSLLPWSRSGLGTAAAQQNDMILFKMVAGLLPVLSCYCSCSVLKQCHSSSSSSSSSSSAEAGRPADRQGLLAGESIQRPAARSIQNPSLVTRAQQKKTICFPVIKKLLQFDVLQIPVLPSPAPLPVFWLSIISICFYFIAWPVGCDKIRHYGRTISVELELDVHVFDQ